MGTRHLDRLGSSFEITLPKDEDGYTGRECPSQDCLGYFKITFGTGLPNATACICPYCGTAEPQDHFHTPDQISYAESVVINKVTGALLKDLKSMEFDMRPRGGFGIGMSMKVKGRPHPVRRYREKRLETRVNCNQCTLRYAIYGVFGYCPDCGSHNSHQILDANLALVEKSLVLAEEQADGDIVAKLTENALEDCVSAFDGWGRETARVHADKANNPAAAAAISFQSFDGARVRINQQFGFDFANSLDADQMVAVQRLFQKRHLLAHRMGVVDNDYVQRTGDSSQIVGRKVTFTTQEIRDVLGALGQLALALGDHLKNL